MRLLTEVLLSLTVVLLPLLQRRWFHAIVSKKPPVPPTKRDIKREELLQAKSVLNNAFYYLLRRESSSAACKLLLLKERDVADALTALERYGLPEDEERPALTYEQNRILDSELIRARDRAVLETLGAFDDPKAIAQADGVPYQRSYESDDIALCTRPAPHVCTVDGPCNGFPRHEGANPAMRLKLF